MMFTTDGLRQILNDFLRKTSLAKAGPPGFFVGDKAEERRVNDDLLSGRLHMLSANRVARQALQALDRGEQEKAEVFYDVAKGFYIVALESRMRPSDWTALGKPAGRRGLVKKKEKPAIPVRKRGRPKKINR